jgi:hypothetical protein
MVLTITQHLADTMGEIGVMPGITAVSGAQQIDWCIGWALADIARTARPRKR